LVGDQDGLRVRASKFLVEERCGEIGFAARIGLRITVHHRKIRRLSFRVIELEVVEFPTCSFERPIAILTQRTIRHLPQHL
jgi:hypothetical protein